MSRLLPNTFALGLTNLACAEWIRGGRPLRVVYLLVFATAVVRCDVLLLLAPVGMHLIISGALSLPKAVAHGLAALAVSLALTVPLDSLFWGRFVWPEARVLIFNGGGRSSAWGVSPPLWYLTSALPRALLIAAPLAPLGALLERRLRPQAFAVAFFVGVYSLLPHKELRFIFPILPLCNALAAAATVRCFRRVYRTRFRGLSMCVLGALLCGQVAAKAALTWAAAWNYPGGWAMVRAEALVGSDSAVRLHVDVLPAMTGVTRFAHPPTWEVFKSENLSDAELQASGATHLLSARGEVAGFEMLQAVDGFVRLAPVLAPLPLKLHTAPQVFIHRRLDTGLHDLGH